MAARERADVVVVGAGLLGLATARALRGRREVLMLEQVSVGHRRGGSYGPSRIFRLGYPDAFYVRLAQVARDRWRALEEEAGVPLLDVNGQLSFGVGLDALLAALSAAGAPARRLDATEVEREFPAFAGHGAAVYEPDSGVLAADRCLNALRASAGCEIREGTRVRRVADDARNALVATDHGELEAEVVVLCPGPWSVNLLPSYAITATFATLEHVAYLRPREGEQPGRLPIVIEYSDPALYGLPTPASNLYKIGFHHAGPVVDPDHSELDADPRMVERLQQVARAWLPAFEPVAEFVETCLYDNTPDEDFVIDRRGRIVMGAGTSGHGFKFGPLLGEMLAALVEDAPPPVDLTRFSLRRFGPRA